MAELIMTEEEINADTWAELDYDTLGKIVKTLSIKLKENERDHLNTWWGAAAILLCNLADDVNAEKLTQDITGLTFAGQHRGNWRITIEKIN